MSDWRITNNYKELIGCCNDNGEYFLGQVEYLAESHYGNQLYLVFGHNLDGLAKDYEADEPDTDELGYHDLDYWVPMYQARIEELGKGKFKKFYSAFDYEHTAQRKFESIKDCANKPKSLWLIVEQLKEEIK